MKKEPTFLWFPPLRFKRAIQYSFALALAIELVLYFGSGRSDSDGSFPITMTTTQIEMFSSGLDALRADCGYFPSTDEGLGALLDDPGDENWKGPYLREEIPPDFWGNPYQYRRRDSRYDIRSFGPDGAPATDDDITNLGPGDNWE